MTKEERTMVKCIAQVMSGGITSCTEFIPDSSDARSCAKCPYRLFHTKGLDGRCELYVNDYASARAWLKTFTFEELVEAVL